MKRRGNKSKKVPNVKLRPAEQGLTQRLSEDCWAQETQLGSDDTIFLDRCPRPFKGLVICATGIPDKPTLFKQAVELGATHTPAFTDRVTHLIADGHGGPKYNCAVERKVPIVRHTWITDNYQVWLKGDDVDAQKSLEDHRLPIFSGIVVCSSGINDITRRTEISKLVTKHGGTYVTKLERPVKVTHLLCSGDEETDKMRYAEKFNNKREASIQLVWEEWFWDSLHYGGRFEEATYQVRRPRPEPKPFPSTATPPPSSSDPGTQHDPPTSPAQQAPQRQTANEKDEADDEPAFFNVLPTVTLRLWSGLLERRGYQVTDGEVILSPSKVKADPPKTATKPSTSPHHPKLPVAESVISSFRRANSFAPVAREDAGSSRPIPFKRAATSAAVFAVHDVQAGPSTAAIVPPRIGPSLAPLADGKTSVPAQHIFAGMTFRVLGEAKTLAVRHAIEEQGGRISADDEEEVTFIIVRLVSGSKIYRQEDHGISRRKYRTECWLEHCLYEERICAPEDHICFLPLSITTPVNGAEQIMMTLSGFEESDKYSLNRLLRALGVTLTSVFNRRNTHLLCHSATGAKYEKAQEWGISVVSLAWLKELAETGKIPDAKVQANNQDLTFRTPAITPNLSMAMVLDGSGTQPGSLPDVQHEASLQGSGQQGRIPSSTSPSPMRPPSLQKGDSSRQSLSPVKIDREATKALQESITSLLGKRPSPEVEESTTEAGATGRAKGSRPGKRARPQRSKPQVKQSSDPPKVEPHRVTRSSATAAAALGSRSVGTTAHVDPFNPFGSYPDEVALPDAGPPQSQQEGIRVMYEDPGQRDEKRRLMNILKGKSSQSVESLDRVTRRSQRIPGF